MTSMNMRMVMGSVLRTVSRDLSYIGSKTSKAAKLSEQLKALPEQVSKLPKTSRELATSILKDLRCIASQISENSDRAARSRLNDRFGYLDQMAKLELEYKEKLELLNGIIDAAKQDGKKPPSVTYEQFKARFGKKPE